jgi:hypothetical protein
MDANQPDIFPGRDIDYAGIRRLIECILKVADLEFSKAVAAEGGYRESIIVHTHASLGIKRGGHRSAKR